LSLTTFSQYPSARTGKRFRWLGFEFAAPTIQGIGINFQLPRHIAYRLAGFQFFDRCQFELSREYPSRLDHRPSSFILIWVLTTCLIFGVHSTICDHCSWPETDKCTNRTGHLLPQIERA